MLEERLSTSALELPPLLFLFSSESIVDMELNISLTSPTTQLTSFLGPSSCGLVGLVSMEVQPSLPTFAAVQVCIVTNLAASVDGLTWILWDYRIEKKWSAVDFCSGAISGLAITPASTASLPTPPRTPRRHARGRSRASCDSDSDENVVLSSDDEEGEG